jgi:RimJ/RimL family protein N-acetyltransferase
MTAGQRLPEGRAVDAGARAAYRLRPTVRADAELFCTWRYGGLYTMYDQRPELRANYLEPSFRYHSVTDPRGALVGFCCFGADARVLGITYDDSALDIGLGMAPALTGRGQGAGFVAAIVDFAHGHFRPSALRLTVAAFNRRAITVYERNRFAVADRHQLRRYGVLLDFLVMKRRCESSSAGP